MSAAPSAQAAPGAGVAGRLARAIERLESARLDGLLLTPGADLRWVSGLGDVHAGERLLALLVNRSGEAVWICPEMNAPQVAEHSAGVADIRPWKDAAGYREALGTAARDLGLDGGTVAVDEEMRAAFLLDFQAACPAVCCLGSQAVMRELRIRKAAEELRRLRASGAVVDAVIPAARAACRPGRSEREVMQAVEAALAGHSGFRPAFCIVASGPNGALPHHETGDRRLQRGDLVILDYGGHLDGYVSDITLTITLGDPADPEVPRVYRTVWEAQQRALEAVRPGATCGSVDRAARAHIEAAGYGDRFLHRTGHGVGLQVHEPPYLLAGSEERLEEGMCFSIEPGIYLEGRFGVRLEVLVAVTAGGVELLNEPSAPELVRV